MISNECPDYLVKNILRSIELCAELVEKNLLKWQDAKPEAPALVYLFQSLHELEGTAGFAGDENLGGDIAPVEQILRDLFKGIRNLQREELEALEKLAETLRDELREIEIELKKKEVTRLAEKAKIRAHKGFIVFLVDDDLAIRHLVRKTMERDQPQWKLLEACDGQDAMDHREWLEEADVIVTDLEMPRMGGRELIDRVFRDSQLSQKSVIIFSGSSEGGLREHWGRNHALQYMDKSCHPKDLVERVKALAMAKGAV